MYLLAFFNLFYYIIISVSDVVSIVHLTLSQI